MRIYFEDDADPQALKDGPIAVLGYGSQGRAHALNLRDSGYPVVIGLRPDGKTAARAKAEGFDVRSPAEAVQGATLVAFLTPDMTHRALVRAGAGPARAARDAPVRARLQRSLRPGRSRARRIDVVLVAPKGPGDLVRRQYEAGPRRALPVRRRAGRHRPREGTRAGLRARRSAARAAACSRRPSRRKPRPTCSASRPCCAAARPSSSSRASKPWSRPATSRRSRTSSACTSSS